MVGKVGDKLSYTIDTVYWVVLEVLNFRVLSKLNFCKKLFLHVDMYKGVVSQHFRRINFSNKHKNCENCKNLVP